MYVKKISAKQFLLDCINKEHEIAGSSLHWDTFEELQKYSDTHENWFNDHSFIDVSQYFKIKDYFLNHFYDWQPKRVSKKEAEKEFSWFMLQYGLRYDFDYTDLKN